MCSIAVVIWVAFCYVDTRGHERTRELWDHACLFFVSLFGSGQSARVVEGVGVVVLCEEDEYVGFDFVESVAFVAGVSVLLP